MTPVGIVAIGRNEGERLLRCLESVRGRGMPVVYVDSGSTDGSVEAARRLGAEVVELDMSTPFSAARARNEGLSRLLACAPGTQYVQFIDGDCEVVDGWVDLACAELDARDDVAVVFGRRRERFPGRSVYNRLADLEWDGPSEATQSCGGDAMMRVSALDEAGRFDPTVPAGEEPELCQRLNVLGWTIMRLDAAMTVHDLAMLHFGQWWRRQVRTGYGGLDVATRFRMPRFRRQVRSVRTWVGGSAAVVVAAAAAGVAFHSALAAGAVLAFVMLAVALQVTRIATRTRKRGVSTATAAAYAVLTVVSKWPQFLGHTKYLRDRRHGRQARLIEYKQATQVAGPSRPGGHGPVKAERGPEDASPTLTREAHRRAELRARIAAAASPWKADLARYPRRPWLKEQSIWAIAVYRFGRWNDARTSGVSRRLFDRAYWLAFRVTETLTGVSLPKSVDIGPGLRIYHFGNIFVNSGAKIGRNCTLRQGVTIGNRHAEGPLPVIEDDVEFGAYAQVLGSVRVGRGAKVGAMSVVLTDVPPGAVAVGVPARIIRPKAEPSLENSDDRDDLALEPLEQTRRY